MTQKTLKEIVSGLEKTVQCNCDLDNWQPEPNTGHSWVCRIHRFAIEEFKHGGTGKCNDPAH